MKGFVIAAALAATTVATPTVEKRASKITPITVKGNGRLLVSGRMATAAN